MGTHCGICHQYSGGFTICKRCHHLKLTGFTNCRNCGSWHDIRKPCSCYSFFEKIAFYFFKLIHGAPQNEYLKSQEYREHKYSEEEKPICFFCQNPTNGLPVCKNCYAKYEQKSVLLSMKNFEITEVKEGTCLICKNPCQIEHHFCKKCYAKYSNKKIAITINKCKDISILDKYGNKTHRCNNGLLVRSDQEVIIANELFRKKIPFIYEETLYFQEETGECTELTPDFYLPDYNIYIEHWGYEDANDPNYLKIKEFKEPRYKKLNVTVIGTHRKDIENINKTIGSIVAKYQK